MNNRTIRSKNQRKRQRKKTKKLKPKKLRTKKLKRNMKGGVLEDTRRSLGDKISRLSKDASRRIRKTSRDTKEKLDKGGRIVKRAGEKAKELSSSLDVSEKLSQSYYDKFKAWLLGVLGLSSGSTNAEIRKELIKCRKASAKLYDLNESNVEYSRKNKRLREINQELVKLIKKSQEGVDRGEGERDKLEKTREQLEEHIRGLEEQKSQLRVQSEQKGAEVKNNKQMFIEHLRKTNYDLGVVNQGLDRLVESQDD